jgi:dienelactone hydrolase
MPTQARLRVCWNCSAVAEVVVFHHALGLNDWKRRFADDLRAAGHTVHTPDLFEGQTFGSIEEGMAYAEENLDFPMGVVERGRQAVESLPSDLVYIGFSLGVMPAQSLAQTRPGARAAVLCYAALPLGQWGDNWPADWPEGVALQLHILEGDEDYEIAKALSETVPGAEFHEYPGTEHYFAEHNPQASAELTRRIIDFLAKLPA